MTALILFCRTAASAGIVAVGTEFQVNTYTAERQSYGSAAIHEDGSFVVL